MIGSIGKQAKGRGIFMSLLAIFSLFLHVLGPIEGLPRKDGYAAICTGTEIVYVSLSSLGIEEGQDQGQDQGPAPKSEQCPWFAQFHALEIDPVSDRHDTIRYERVRFRAPAARPVASVSLTSSLARAPPHHAV